MLVLNRKKHESIVIDGPAEVFILGIVGTRVSVGIEADKSVKILRREIMQEPAPVEEVDE